MTTQTEVLKLALEALETGKPMFDAYWGSDHFGNAITAIKEVLAQPEQEPAYRCVPYSSVPGEKVSAPVDYYTTPPQRKPLTDGQIDNATRKQVDALLDHIYEYGTAAEGIDIRVRAIARRAIEAAHGIKE